MVIIVPDFDEYAERFCVRTSVIENFYEEYQLEVEACEFEISFYEFLVEEFARRLI